MCVRRYFLITDWKTILSFFISAFLVGNLLNIVTAEYLVLLYSRMCN